MRQTHGAALPGDIDRTGTRRVESLILHVVDDADDRCVASYGHGRDAEVRVASDRVLIGEHEPRGRLAQNRAPELMMAGVLSCGIPALVGRPPLGLKASVFSSNGAGGRGRGSIRGSGSRSPPKKIQGSNWGWPKPMKEMLVIARG